LFAHTALGPHEHLYHFAIFGWRTLGVEGYPNDWRVTQMVKIDAVQQGISGSRAGDANARYAQ
jgi:hypothetical protein